MSSPANLKYTNDHEWARIEEDGTVTIGITEHAQDALGDVVFVELPEVGDEVEAEGRFGVVESVKTVSDLFAPCEGEVIATNGALEDAPETVNGDPYGDGWMIRLKPADASQLDALMDASAYDAFVAAEAG
ncbi:MAG: glycine cleavage system protein GcvH [Myxococcota bacterium]|nr:glycine cleavage system protein GcvH [Myxococcota bacterium]